MSESPVMTKSIYEPAEPGDGLRVLITRYYPRGVRRDRFDLWVRALAPSRELLSGYRRGTKTWDQFKESFVSELRANPDSVGALRKVAAASKVRDVTLLCYEKDGLPCHRRVVQDILSSPGLLATYAPAERAAPSEVAGHNHHHGATRSASGSSVIPSSASLFLPVVSEKRFYSRRKVGGKAPK